MGVGGCCGGDEVNIGRNTGGGEDGRVGGKG